MKLRLEIEIDFVSDEDPSDDLEEYRQAIDEGLIAIAQHAAANGLFTGGIPEVNADTWEARVVRLE